MTELTDLAEGTASVEQYQKMGYIGLRMGIESGQITDTAAVRVMAQQEVIVLEGNKQVFEQYWGEEKFGKRLKNARDASEDNPFHQETYCNQKMSEVSSVTAPEGLKGVERANWDITQNKKRMNWLEMNKRLMQTEPAFMERKYSPVDINVNAASVLK